MTAKIEFEGRVWQLVVRACGGRCCICRVDDGRQIVRGHVKRDEDGGSADFCNLIPVCKSCNSKYKSGPTPDERPADWFERFLGLARAEYSGQKVLQQNNLLNDTESTDSIEVESAPSPEIDRKSHYITCIPKTPLSAPQIVDEIIDASAGWGDEIGQAPKPPKRERRAEMEQHARDCIAAGCAADFKLACEIFKMDKPWLNGDPRHPYVDKDSWLLFVHNFKSYMRRGRAITKQRAENGRIEREAAAKWREDDRVKQYQNRWANHMLVAGVPLYSGISDAHRELIAKVQAEKAAGAEQRAITDDEDEQDRRLLGAHLNYLQRELEKEKQKRREHLRQLQLRDVDGEHTEEVINVRDWLNGVKSVEELLSYENEIIGAYENNIESSYHVPTQEELAERAARLARGEDGIPF